MSPLQSLMALHGSPQDASHRYISRMQQAVRVLYGSASPSEAFQSTSLRGANGGYCRFRTKRRRERRSRRCPLHRRDAPVPVRADEFPWRTCFPTSSKNADRHRRAGNPITIAVAAGDNLATVSIHNFGPHQSGIAGQDFEYGVSDQPAHAAEGHRGQGLFVAKTYMARWAARSWSATARMG